MFHLVPTTTPPPPPPESSSCFPLMAKVKIENGKSVQISELQIGDKVQTGTIIELVKINTTTVHF